MENKAFDDSDSDITTEHEKNLESVQKNKPSEVDDINEKGKQLKEVQNEEIEDKLLRHATPVADNDSVTPADGATHNPPPRQRTRSKTRKETYAEADTPSEVNKERKRETEENHQCQSKETTQTMQINMTGTNTRNIGKKTDTPEDDKGKMQPAADKNVKEVETNEMEKSESAVGLKKELGLLNCIGIIVGIILGTGIFVTPRTVLQYTGSVGMSLIVWMISGVMTIVGALCYTELGTMIPQSGGKYTYLHEAYGPLPAFIYMWITVAIFIPSTGAVMSLTFASYVVQPFFPNEQTPPQSALCIIGILLILLLSYINGRRVRWATRVQDILTLAKVLAFIVIIAVGIFHLTRGTTDNFKDPMAGTSTNPALVATAFYQSLYSYQGWDSLNVIMEELKDPFRNMPRAIAISLTIVTIIYMLTNVAYFAVLPKDLLLASPALAVTVLSLLMFVTSDVSLIINYSAFSSNLLDLATMTTFFWFRLKCPDLARPFKVWIGFPIIYTILSFFLCVMPVISNPLEVVAALVVIGTGLPVYYFLVRTEVKPQRLVTVMDKVTYVCQLFFKAVPEERDC